MKKNQSMEYLELADWRRRIAALYAGVREMAATDPRRAWHAWRSERERLYREHSQSPVPPAARAGFRARYFPYDEALRFDLPVGFATASESGPSKVDIPTSAGDLSGFWRIGWVDVPFPTGAGRLTLFWLPEYAGGLFLSFRDGTNGAQTYGGGRYLLDGAKSADLGGNEGHERIVLDFNFSYQPSCAFDPRWQCPLVPPENQLGIPVAAGERLQ